MTGPFSRKRTAAPELVSEPTDLLSDGSLAAAFVSEILEAGTQALATNAASQAMVMRYGDHALPVLVEDGSYGRTYVTSAHSAYVLYARDEMNILELSRLNRWAGHGSIGALDQWLRAIQINRAVHLNHWLLSTNLHGRWKGDGLAEMRAILADRFPDHFCVIRSLDPWSCPDLLEAARSDGWTLLPSRQNWVTDDLERDWKPRNHASSDRRKLKKSGLIVEDPHALSLSDAERIASLYNQLYRGRYSGMNPAYTPHFVEMSARVGLLRYRVARAADGQIMAFTAMRIAGGVLTTPLIGYDMERPQSEGLYRIASYLSSQWAHEYGLRHHGSSGAGTFKSNRGAKGVIEYMAVHGGHLSRSRRNGLKMLGTVLERTMVPMLKSQGW